MSLKPAKWFKYSYSLAFQRFGRPRHGKVYTGAKNCSEQGRPPSQVIGLDSRSDSVHDISRRRPSGYVDGKKRLFRCILFRCITTLYVLKVALQMKTLHKLFANRRHSRTGFHSTLCKQKH